MSGAMTQALTSQQTAILSCTVDGTAGLFLEVQEYTAGRGFSTLASPFHPQGESPDQIDRPTYGHLGKKIKFSDLPEDCQTLVLQDYKEIWGLA